MMDRTPEEIAIELSLLVKLLVKAGRNDLLLQSIGLPVIEDLRVESAKRHLSRLQITKDYRFFLIDYCNKEVELSPIHKAVYLLFLNHPEGIEFKYLQDFRDELLCYYTSTSRIMNSLSIAESVNMLINPLNNSINEKCSRIKSTFFNMMDQYTAKYYIVSSHTQKHTVGSSKLWYERLKAITLPRELVIRE